MPNIAENIPRVYPSAKVAQAAECYSEIKRWTEIYSGNPEWKKVNFTGLKGEKSRLMDMVNGAKMLCDRMSALTFAEQCDITVSREQEFLDSVLEKTASGKKFPVGCLPLMQKAEEHSRFIPKAVKSRLTLLLRKISSP